MSMPAADSVSCAGAYSRHMSGRKVRVACSCWFGMPSVWQVESHPDRLEVESHRSPGGTSLMPSRYSTTVCSIPDCGERRTGREWCTKHYARWRRHGDPLFTRRPMWGQPSAVRFFAKVDASGVCWEWTASNDGCKGYGRFDKQSAHRWAFEYLVGPIPAGMTLDHLCRNPACVNPDHLEVVSFGVNTLRGGSVSALNARKTHCLRGHPFSDFNTKTYRRPDTGTLMRICLTCRPPKIRKTHCMRGHAFDEANTGTNTSGGRWCRTCDRERRRARDATRMRDQKRKNQMCQERRTGV